MHAHAPKAQRFLRPPGLLFHAQRRDWSRRLELHWHGHLRPAGFESAVFPNFTTPRKSGADRGSRTLTSLRSPDSRSGAYTVSPHPQKLEHPQGRAPCCLSYQDSPSLSTGWMQNGRSGRTRTRIARLRGGSPELLRGRGAENWSARQDSHLHGLAPTSF